jgi:hypothetical protein
MSDTTANEFVPLIHHLPFVVVFIVAAVIAMLRREMPRRRKRLLLTGLALLLLERVVAVWIHFADLTVTPPESAVTVARRISTVIYLDWALSVVGVTFLILAALSREVSQSRGVMPNTSFERTREG